MVSQRRLAELRYRVIGSKVSPGEMRSQQFCEPNNRRLDDYLANFNYTRQTFNVLLRQLHSDYPDNIVVVIDLMCGAGNAVKDLNRLNGVAAFGVDRLSYFEWKKSERAFAQGCVENLFFIPNNCINLVFNVFGMFFGSYVKKWRYALSESVRILKPGGYAFYYPASEPVVVELRRRFPEQINIRLGATMSNGWTACAIVKKY